MATLSLLGHLVIDDSRNEKNGDARKIRLGSDEGTDFIPALVGHDHVRDDQVGAFPSEERQRLCPIGGERYGHTCLGKKPFRDLSDGNAVIGD